MLVWPQYHDNPQVYISLTSHVGPHCVTNESPSRYAKVQAIVFIQSRYFFCRALRDGNCPPLLFGLMSDISKGDLCSSYTPCYKNVKPPSGSTLLWSPHLFGMASSDDYFSAGETWVGATALSNHLLKFITSLFFRGDPEIYTTPRKSAWMFSLHEIKLHKPAINLSFVQICIQRFRLARRRIYIIEISKSFWWMWTEMLNVLSKVSATFPEHRWHRGDVGAIWNLSETFVLVDDRPRKCKVLLCRLWLVLRD